MHSLFARLLCRLFGHAEFSGFSFDRMDVGFRCYRCGHTRWCEKDSPMPDPTIPPDQLAAMGALADLVCDLYYPTLSEHFYLKALHDFRRLLAAHHALLAERDELRRQAWAVAELATEDRVTDAWTSEDKGEYCTDLLQRAGVDIMQPVVEAPAVDPDCPHPETSTKDAP